MSTDQAPTIDELTTTEREVLAFERTWWKYAGAKEAKIRESFGMTAIRYYQLLNALLDKPAALEVDPLLLVRRIDLERGRLALRCEGQPLTLSGSGATPTALRPSSHPPRPHRPS